MLLHAPDSRPVSQALANRLWSRLRLGQIDGYHFSRQCPLGGHVADFYCPEASLVVQMDSARTTERARAAHAEAFELEGYRVVHLSEYELIDDMDAAVRKIRAALGVAPAKVRPLRHLH
jgi:very-short-patch-repair endonuclease